MKEITKAKKVAEKIGVLVTNWQITFSNISVNHLL